MIEIIDKNKCSGCTACASICPINCIVMTEDSEGFLYPVIDKQNCIHCNKCENVCPIINPISINESKDLRTWVMRTKNQELLEKCTSGGVFTTLSNAVIKDNGLAVGAVYDEDFHVLHKVISNTDEVVRLAGSKYVQSNVVGIFNQIRDYLELDKQVIFCGTPCQVAGLHKVLGKDYSNLITVDLVCHGVPSPKLWQKYIELISKKNGKIDYVNFRSKYLGYHVSTMEEVFVGGKRNIGSARTNLMSKIFFKNIADRPICYCCPFKTLNRCSDLTLYDSWHADELVRGLKDDDRGYTNVLIHSAKGKKIIEQYQYLFEMYEIDTEDAIRIDGKMALSSVKRPDQRDEFYEYLYMHGIESAVDKYFPIKKIDYIIERIKIFMSRLGILHLIKIIKDKCS